jgi:hypothetical protein
LFFKPICEAPFTIEFENDELPKEELKRLIFEETVSINAQSIANNSHLNNQGNEVMEA